MDLGHALLLGLVEGLTEYLPVSSTAHLLVTERLLGLPDTEATRAFAICIQGGAIVAVLLLYGRRLIQVLRGLLGRDAAGRRLLVALLAAFLPAGVIGKLLDDRIEALLFGLWPIAVAWIAGGLLILYLERDRSLERGQPAGRRWPQPGGAALEALDARRALLIGLAQCLAMWPGVSRSLATILAGLAVGLSMAAALEFSFLLGLMTLGAATVFKAHAAGGAMVAELGWPALIAGFAAAALTAAVAVKWMVAWLSGHGLRLFAWWRLAAGAALVAALLLGWSGR
jgi:undecaprenyl-diphosphatase